jgi:type II secretion system protein C
VLKPVRIEIWIAAVALIFLFLAADGFSATARIAKGERFFPKVSLAGILVSENASSSVAILRDQTDGKIVLLKIGEKIQSLKLIGVYENRVVFYDGQGAYELFWGFDPRAAGIQKPPGRASGTAARDQTDDISQNDEDKLDQQKMFTRPELEAKVRAELPALMKKCQMALHFVNGQLAGARIVRLPEGSALLEELGIRENDIVKQVNEIKLNDFSAMSSIYNSLQSENHFVVLIERGGKLYRYSYDLKK